MVCADAYLRVWVEEAILCCGEVTPVWVKPCLQHLVKKLSEQTPSIYSQLVQPLSVDKRHTELLTQVCSDRHWK